MAKPLDELLEESDCVPAGPERDAWIDAACGSDPRLAQELRELIAAREATPALFLASLARRSRDEAIGEGER